MLQLLSDLLLRVQLIYHLKEAHELRVMARQYLQLLNEISSLLQSEQRQLVDVISIPAFSQFLYTKSLRIMDLLLWHIAEA